MKSLTNMLKNRRARALVFLTAIGACIFALSSAAIAQPAPGNPTPGKPAAGKPAPGKPGAGRQVGKDGRPGAKPGLPNWHPPVGPNPKLSPEQSRERMRRMREAAQKVGGRGRGRNARPVGMPPGVRPNQPTAAPKAPRKPKYPVDAHGYCLGNGPNDVPRPINLMHGWLGYKDKYAAEDGLMGPMKPPRLERRTPEMSFFDNLTRQIPYWKWRLMPYPYRYENHDDHCDPKNQPIPLLANIINVGVLFLLIRRFGKKPLMDGLKARKDGIMSEIDRARGIRKDASGRLQKYQEALDNLDDKLESLREQYAAEGDTEEKRLVDEMGETRDRMMDDASFRVSQEGKGARDALSREALAEALAAAEVLLQNGVTKADHDRIANEYLEQVGPALAEQLRNYKQGNLDRSDEKA